MDSYFYNRDNDEMVVIEDADGPNMRRPGFIRNHIAQIITAILAVTVGILIIWLVVASVSTSTDNSSVLIIPDQSIANLSMQVNGSFPVSVSGDRSNNNTSTSAPFPNIMPTTINGIQSGTTSTKMTGLNATMMTATNNASVTTWFPLLANLPTPNCSFSMSIERKQATCSDCQQLDSSRQANSLALQLKINTANTSLAVECVLDCKYSKIYNPCKRLVDRIRNESETNSGKICKRWQGCQHQQASTTNSTSATTQDE